MPWNTGDIVRFNVAMTTVQQTARNIYYYRIEAAINSITGNELAEAFFNFQDTVIMNALSQTVTLNSVQVDNVTDGLSFGEFAASGFTGAITGEAMGPFIAYGYTLLRTNKLTRNGFKRFPGVVEDAQNNGAIQSSWVNYNRLLTIETQLAATLNLSGASGQVDVAPVIYGDVNANRPSPVWQYVSEAALSPRLTTQSSRKVGRGE